VSFSFEKWRDWLAGESGKLSIPDTRIVFRIGDSHLPSMAIELENLMAIGSFRAWKNALADYEIVRIDGMKFLENETMIELSDHNFASVFNTFLQKFKMVD
jgi:hypothetical protein